MGERGSAGAAAAKVQQLFEQPKYLRIIFEKYAFSSSFAPCTAASCDLFFEQAAGADSYDLRRF
ncbi:MAG: hypothetical protein LBG47_10100 [Prevotellaceae bacterium]|jgi:hypothetical protein|nr:hypothetical protein [Prevotellaceae bacterium]